MADQELNRQAGESNPAWEARRIYVNMGPTRSIRSVGQELGKSGSLISRWSARWGWATSARAFDVYMQEITSKIAADRALADAQAYVGKWAARSEEQPEFDYNVFVDSYNDLIGYISDVKEGRRKANPTEKFILQRSYIRCSLLAREACRDAAERMSARGPGADRGPDGPTVPPAPGRALAVLRAFNEFEASKDGAG